MEELSPNRDFFAALFDMDGTLVDSTALVESEWQEWASSKGLEPTQVALYSHGRRTEDVIAHYFPGCDVDHELNLFRAMAGKLDQSSVRGIPGAVKFVLSLKESQWAVVTSAPATIARQRLDACGFPCPKVLVSADDVVSGKPDPEGFLKACRELKMTPNDCVVFEDAPAGVVAALAAKMAVVALRTTHPNELFEGCIQLDDFKSLSANSLPGGGFRLVFSS